MYVILIGLVSVVKSHTTIYHVNLQYTGTSKHKSKIHSGLAVGIFPMKRDWLKSGRFLTLYFMLIFPCFSMPLNIMCLKTTQYLRWWIQKSDVTCYPEQLLQNNYLVVSPSLWNFSFSHREPFVSNPNIKLISFYLRK